jgi:hypothetical protein
MYPATFFALFPPFPLRNEVFVAMSFASKFAFRWEEVIQPAIRRIRANEVPFEPVRVDTRRVSDSILTEILRGVSQSRLIFADITTIGILEDRPVRNSNVLYEVGLAHATRRPEEVLLFRSDDDALPFDTAHTRVNSFSPETAPDAAKDAIAHAMMDALRETDLQRSLAVQKAADSLDHPSWWILATANGSATIPYPKMHTTGQVLANSRHASAIARLLDLGALRTTYLAVTPEVLNQIGDSPDADLLNYEITEFGKAIFREGAARIGLFSPEMQKLLAASANP